MDELYLVCYDFPATKPGNRRRAKVAKFLEGHGDRVQYSVFELRMKDAEEVLELERKLQKLIDDLVDSVRIYRMNTMTESDIRIVGQGEIFTIQEAYIV